MPHREKTGAAVVRRCGTPGSACRRERLPVVFVPGVHSDIKPCVPPGHPGLPPPGRSRGACWHAALVLLRSAHNGDALRDRAPSSPQTSFNGRSPCSTCSCVMAFGNIGKRQTGAKGPRHRNGAARLMTAGRIRRCRDRDALATVLLCTNAAVSSAIASRPLVAPRTPDAIPPSLPALFHNQGIHL